MFTKYGLLKAKIDLYNIVANHALESYYQANPKGIKRKKRKPYSASQEELKALAIYKMIANKQPEDITAEEEEIVKAFLLFYRLFKTEYLKEGYKGGHWYYKEQLNAIKNVDCSANK